MGFPSEFPEVTARPDPHPTILGKPILGKTQGPESFTRHVQNLNELQDRFLRHGYFRSMLERHPLNNDVRKCSTLESSYFLTLEQEAMQIPPELEYKVLEEYIPDEHRVRMRKIWDQVNQMQKQLGQAKSVLLGKWQNPVKTVADTQAFKIVSQMREYFTTQFEEALTTIIATAEADTALENWKTEEKFCRKGFFEATKKAMLALRVYYEMLLERAPKNIDGTQSNKKAVLRLDYPHREKIVLLNRRLRIVDATHQALAIAKTAHHGQDKQRLRKTIPVPYLNHVIDATGAYLFDTVHYTVDEMRLKFNPLVGAIAMAWHDIPEDTNISYETIKQYAARMVDIYDSRIMIQSGYIDPLTEKTIDQEKIKERKLNLLTPEIIEEVYALLKILSKNTELTLEEKMRAHEQNILGEEQTVKILGIKPDETVPVKKPSKTISIFPDCEDKKMDAFLVRLCTIRPKITMDPMRIQQQAIICKMSDRWSNITTLAGTTRSHQRKTLRGTVTRLLAWAMLDHKQKKYPLYNALPRLIDATLEAYENFERTPTSLDEEESSSFEAEKDGKYMKYLRAWKDQVKREEEPEHIKKIRDIMVQ